MYEDLSRTVRQQGIVQKWRMKPKSTVIAATGFGKTRIATMIIEKLVQKKANIHVVVIVPTIPIQNQWKKRVKDLQNVNGSRIDVFCFNTFWTLNTSCDLLIVDEAHMAVADQTWETICNANFRYFLALTATLHREDKRHELLIKHFPVIDVVSREECIDNGWISPFDIQTAKVIPKEARRIEALSTNIKVNLQRCPNYIEVLEDPNAYPQLTRQLAFQLQNDVFERRRLICSDPAKMDLAEDFVRAFVHQRLLVFFEFIEDVQNFYERIKDLSVNWVASSYYTGKEKYDPKKKKMLPEKKILSKKKRQQILDDFNDGKFNVLLASKVLDLGADIADLNRAIIVASSKNPTQFRQRLGRIIRFDGRVCHLTQIVAKDTVEEKWMKNRMK